MTDAVAAIATGALQPSALVADALATIAARDSVVQAWQHVSTNAARARVPALREPPARGGVLDGIPIGIKDVIDTADMPTGYGSNAYSRFRPAADAACVTLLRAAGAVILGKTVSTEFASVTPSRTTNPHNPGHTPGGSSSGSAAAVAAGMVPAALGTQTAGSIIRPAAYCGVVGYKPSFGLIDATGVKTLARSFDTVGTFTGSVRDAALLVSVLADRPTLAGLDGRFSPRVGIYVPPWASTGAPCAVDILHHVGGVLREAGLPVTDVAEIEGFDQLLAAQQDVMDWDMVHALLYELTTIPERISPVTRAALEMRRKRMSPRACDMAHAQLACLRERLHARMDGVDVLLVPSAPGEAPRGLSSTGSSDFNRGWTALHVPCIHLPAGCGPSGMPLGVQVIGRLREDGRALAAAAAIERHLVGNRFNPGP